jgi:hypothetical protein
MDVCVCVCVCVMYQEYVACVCVCMCVCVCVMCVMGLSVLWMSICVCVFFSLDSVPHCVLLLGSFFHPHALYRHRKTTWCTRVMESLVVICCRRGGITRVTVLSRPISSWKSGGRPCCAPTLTPWVVENENVVGSRTFTMTVRMVPRPPCDVGVRRNVAAFVRQPPDGYAALLVPACFFSSSSVSSSSSSVSSSSSSSSPQFSVSLAPPPPASSGSCFLPQPFPLVEFLSTCQPPVCLSRLAVSLIGASFSHAPHRCFFSVTRLSLSQRKRPSDSTQVSVVVSVTAQVHGEDGMEPVHTEERFDLEVRDEYPQLACVRDVRVYLRYACCDACLMTLLLIQPTCLHGRWTLRKVCWVWVWDPGPLLMCVRANRASRASSDPGRQTITFAGWNKRS